MTAEKSSMNLVHSTKETPDNGDNEAVPASPKELKVKGLEEAIARNRARIVEIERELAELAKEQKRMGEAEIEVQKGVVGQPAVETTPKPNVEEEGSFAAFPDEKDLKRQIDFYDGKRYRIQKERVAGRKSLVGAPDRKGRESQSETGEGAGSFGTTGRSPERKNANKSETRS